MIEISNGLRERLNREHKELAILSENLGALCKQPRIATQREWECALQLFRDRLRSHFEWEERGHETCLLRVLAEQRPERLEAGRALLAKHDDLLAKLELIITAITDREHLDKTIHKFGCFLEAYREHEAAEQALFCDTYRGERD